MKSEDETMQPDDETPHGPREVAPVEEPEEDVPDPAVPVEPRLSFGAFAAVSDLSGPAQSALRKWMTLYGGSPDRHYSLDEWQDYRARMLAYS